MKKIIKKKYYILSFIIPLILYIIFLTLKKVIPNIEVLFVTDLRVQHLPFFSYLKSVLMGKSSFQYSYYAGMGSPMISALVFYAISPLNILLVLIKDIRWAIFSIYLLKMCLSGLTMFIFLKNKFKKESYMTVAFSTCYALSAYVINYFFCVFWLDAIYLAPLVLLGIDKIFDKEKINLLYIFSLSLTIICNIQMGFGLCIFSVIYYLYSFSIKYNIKKDFKKFVKLGTIFAISSLCAGAISSGFILAFLTDHKSSTIARNLGDSNYSQTTSIDYIIKNMFSLGKIKTSYHNEYEPLLYSGLIVSLLSILYLFDKNIDKKKRKSALIVILVFIISFFIKKLNIFWHLSQPIYLNYRYSIYLSLFLILISYDYYINKDKFTKKDIIILTISMLIGLLFDLIYQKEIYLIHTIIFLVLSGILIILVKKITKKLEIILCIVIVVELTFNAYLSFYNAYELPFDRYSSYNSFHKLYDARNFSQDYRIGYEYTYTEKDNDGFLLNKNSSLTFFSSVIKGNIVRFIYYNYSGASKNGYSISPYDSPLLVSLMGAKYFYLLDDIDSELYKKIDTYKIKSYDYTKKKVDNKKVYLYENPYALSLGYVINKDAKHIETDTLVDYQNRLIKSFTGNDKEVMKKIMAKKKENDEYCANVKDSFCKTYQVSKETNSEYIYLYTPSYQIDTSEDINVYNFNETPFLLKGKPKEFEISLYYPEEYSLDNVIFATYDKKNLIEDLKMLQENMLTNIKIDKNTMKAKIDSSKDGILFLSIPYDKNFKIYVDGKKTKYYPLLDNSFTGLDIKKGNHNIKIVNTNDNLKWYILSSVSSLLITILLYKYINKKI